MTDAPRHINDLLGEIITTKSNIINQLGDFVDALHERGFGVLILLFSLPMALPIPVPPGMNLLFALPLCFLSAQQIIGAHKPWLPLFIRNKEFDQKKMAAIIKKAEPWLNRLSFFIRPRLGFMTQGLFSKLIGVFGVCFALCVCIPIPMTNTVPSFAILLMALGVLMRDGLAIIGGMIVGSTWIALLATLGVSGFKALISYIL